MDSQEHVPTPKPCRLKSGLKVKGLSPKLVKALRDRIRYKGEIDRLFFENYVWWWRPLVELLGPKHTNLKNLLGKKVSFFPKELFATIRRAEEMRSIPALIQHWINLELGARLRLQVGSRLMEPYVINWPNYVPELNWTSWNPAKDKDHYLIPVHLILDFRKDDEVLISEFAWGLKLTRKQFATAGPFPGLANRRKKNSYITKSSFSILEVIDLEFSLNERGHHDQLGNARKIVSENREYYMRRLFEYIPPSNPGRP